MASLFAGYTLTLAFPLCAIVSCSYLYYNCAKVLLKKKKPRSRDSILTFCFGLICMFWALCWFPLVATSLSLAHIALIDAAFYTKIKYQSVELSCVLATFQIMRRLYGLLNSVVIIVLIRDFQYPLLKALAFFKKKLNLWLTK